MDVDVNGREAVNEMNGGSEVTTTGSKQRKLHERTRLYAKETMNLYLGAYLQISSVLHPKFEPKLDLTDRHQCYHCRRPLV